MPVLPLAEKRFGRKHPADGLQRPVQRELQHVSPPVQIKPVSAVKQLEKCPGLSIIICE